MLCKTSLALKFVVLLVSKQLFVTFFFCFFVVSTINSYCLIMLYYSFSIEHRGEAVPNSAVVVVVVACCIARFSQFRLVWNSLAIVLFLTS